MDEDGFTIVAKGSKRCAHGNRGAFRNPRELADLACESWTTHSREHIAPRQRLATGPPHHDPCPTLALPPLSLCV